MIQPKRLEQLDGIRGIAILLVVVWHYFCCQLVGDRYTTIWYLGVPLTLTRYGVDLFFTLSGFLIVGILLDQRNADNFFRVFYLRRVCRIWPLYFTVLLLFMYLPRILELSGAPFQWLLANPMPLWSYATFTQNILMGLHGPGANGLGPTWSLAVEEQFYVVMPAVVWLLPRRVVLMALAALIFALPLLRFISPAFHPFMTDDWRPDCLLFGACLAIAIRWRPFLQRANQHPRLLSALMLALVCLLVWNAYSPDVLGIYRRSTFGLLCSLFILFAIVQPQGHMGGFLQSRLLVWLGTLSYGIYMLHQGVSGLVHGFIRGDEPHIASAFDGAVTLLALALTLALAALSYRYLESPFLRFGHSFHFVPGVGHGEVSSGRESECGTVVDETGK